MAKRAGRWAIVAAALALAGTATHAQSEPQEFTVIMDNMDYGQMPSGAEVGDTIIWVNRDTVQHTATARNGSFDVRLQPGERGRTVLKEAGTIAIYCIYHPMMRARLKVAS